jgi:P-type conjugative transfer protein TrbL
MPPFLDTVLSDFQNGINALTPLIVVYGMPIFGTIALLAFAAAAFMSMVRRDLGATLDALAYTIAVIACGEWFFSEAVPWMTALQQTFIQYGQQLTGQSPATLTPSGVLAQGIVIASQLLTAAGTRSWFFMSLAELAALVAGVIVIFAFIGIAIILLLCEVELATVIVLGSIVLIFSVLPWVLPSLQRYALTVLGLGVKLIALLCIIGLGLIEAAGWTADLAAHAAKLTKDFHLIFLPAGEAILFVAVAYFAPNIIAGLVSGGAGPSIGLGEMFLGAAAAEGGAAARQGAQMAATAGIGAASSAAGTAAGTAARAVRNMLLQS